MTTENTDRTDAEYEDEVLFWYGNINAPGDQTWSTAAWQRAVFSLQAAGFLTIAFTITEKGREEFVRRGLDVRAALIMDEDG